MHPLQTQLQTTPQCAEGLNLPSLDNLSPHMAIPPYYLFSEPPTFGKKFLTKSPQ